MRKLCKWFLILVCLSLVLDFFGILSDKATLRQSLVRLHVVAASDTEEHQAAKLKVRDAVVAYVDEALSHVMTLEEAKQWIHENLPGIEAVANDVLQRLGLKDRAAASFRTEDFPTRHYDTFSLPAGVYSSLRITIGEGAGQNWWCVIFPSLCMPAAGEDTESVTAGAGFSDTLTNTVCRKSGYKLRFYVLEVLGKLENFFFRR